VNVFGLHQMHVMQTILTDVRSVCLSVRLSVMWLTLAPAHAVYAVCSVSSAFNLAFAKLLWQLDIHSIKLKC